MTMFQPIAKSAERMMATLVAGLELEFGRGAGEALAARFIAAEECDFTWDARSEERWLGMVEDASEEDGAGAYELDRVAIFGRFDGRWFAAICIVDGEGRAHGMIGRRCFIGQEAARSAFAAMH